jgi:hypothetical protein
MNIVKPPNELPVPSDGNTVPNSVFLAGSIGGNADLTKMADDWQSIMTGYFEQFDFIQYVFNPRRDDWDPSWGADNRKSAIQRTGYLGIGCPGPGRHGFYVLRPEHPGPNHPSRTWTPRNRKDCCGCLS